MSFISKMVFVCSVVPPSLGFAAPGGTSSELVDIVASSQNQFGWKAFDLILASESNTKNVLFSPLSAYIALSLASNGATGETLNEMVAALKQQGLTRQELNEGVQMLVESLTRGDTAETVHVANAMWANDQLFAFAEEFKDIAAEYYRAEAKAEPFTPPETLIHINSWVNDNTGGMIPTIIEQLDPGMIAILLNALFFEAQWYEPFSVAGTTELDFTRADGRKVPVQMMGKFAMIDYAESDELKMVSLAFRSNESSDDGRFAAPRKGRFRLDLVLPKGDSQIAELVGSSLNGESYGDLVSRLEPTASGLAIPKFKFDYKKTLVPQLSSLGINRAFQPGEAQFQRLGEALGGMNTYIDTVLQKTAVEMDENGFKAAAVTAVIFRTTSAIVPQAEFIANRPFFLSLRDTETGAVLFQGVVADPNW